MVVRQDNPLMGLGCRHRPRCYGLSPTAGARPQRPPLVTVDGGGHSWSSKIHFWMDIIAISTTAFYLAL